MIKKFFDICLDDNKMKKMLMTYLQKIIKLKEIMNQILYREKKRVKIGKILIFSVSMLKQREKEKYGNIFISMYLRAKTEENKNKNKQIIIYNIL